MTRKTKLDAKHLKAALWDTLQDLQSGDCAPSQGDAIASQAREILRTVRVQLQVLGQAKEAIPGGLVDFAQED